MTDNFSSHSEPLALASRIVAAYVSNNEIDRREIGPLLGEVYKSILAAASGGGREPAVPVERSVTKDHIICLEDGKPLRMLKRYLRNHYNLSPEEYRAKWGLPADYPMNAPGYSEVRSKFAREIGLGKTPAPKRKKRKARKAKSARRKAEAAAPVDKMIAQSFNGRRILPAVAQ